MSANSTDHAPLSHAAIRKVTLTDHLLSTGRQLHFRQGQVGHRHWRRRHGHRLHRHFATPRMQVAGQPRTPSPAPGNESPGQSLAAVAARFPCGLRTRGGGTQAGQGPATVRGADEGVYWRRRGQCDRDQDRAGEGGLRLFVLGV